LTKTLLFIGDSITESGRFEDSQGIGDSYVRNIVESGFIKGEKWNVLNRGVSGDRITDLKERWDQDVLAHRPDVLSISIGVNDVWRQLDHPDLPQVTRDEFRSIYRQLLNRVSANTKLILMEPTIIEENSESKGNQLLSAYVAIVQELAEEYNAILVPTHREFIKSLKDGDHEQLTTDGVHMTDAGNKLMANSWMKTVPIEIF